MIVFSGETERKEHNYICLIKYNPSNYLDSVVSATFSRGPRLILFITSTNPRMMAAVPSRATTMADPSAPLQEMLQDSAARRVKSPKAVIIANIIKPVSDAFCLSPISLAFA